MKTLLGVLFVLLALSSCATDENYRAADAATFDAIAPEYLDYVEADADLDDDQKQNRRDTVQAWRLRLESWGD